jgi:uncharacterized protein YraI
MLFSLQTLKRVVQIFILITLITVVIGYTTRFAQGAYDPLDDNVATVFFKVVNVASNDALNIRSSSTTSSKKIGQIASDESCLVYLNRRDDSKRWVKVSYKGVEGWVSLNYLQIHNSPTCWRYYQVNNVQSNDTLNMRDSPSPYSRQVGNIPHNGSCLLRVDDVVVSETRWYMVEYGGVKGWVNTRYLRRIDVDDCDV